MPKAVVHPLVDTDRTAEIYRLEGKALAAEALEVEVVRMGTAGLIFKTNDTFDDGTDLAVQNSPRNRLDRTHLWKSGDAPQ